MSLTFSPSSAKHRLEGGVFRIPESLRIKRSLTIEGPGTLVLESSGPGFLVEGALNLIDVRLERAAGWGCCIQVMPKGRLKCKRSVVTGARSWFDLPEPRPPLPAGVSSLSGEIECWGRATLEDVTLMVGGFAGLVVDGEGVVSIDQGQILGGTTYGVNAGGKSDVSLIRVGLSGQGMASFSTTGRAKLVAKACRCEDSQSSLIARDASAVQMIECETLNSRSHDMTLYGEASLLLDRCVISDGKGWGMVANGTAHVIVRQSTFRRLGGSGLDVGHRATVELLENTRLIDISGAGALVHDAGRLVLNQVSITTAGDGIDATDVATVDESDVTITTGKAPRCAWLLAQWYGATPLGPLIDASAIIRFVWAKFSDPNKNVDDRRALLQALAERAEWAFGAPPWPATIDRLLAIIELEKEMLIHGGRAALEGVLLRDVANGELCQVVGLSPPLTVFDWQVIRRVPVVPVTALTLDQAGVAITGTHYGQLQRDGVDWLTLKKTRILALCWAHDQIGVDLDDGIAWLDAEGKCLGRWSSDSSRDLFDARPVGDGQLGFTLSDTSGHPTDRCTRQLKISVGQSIGQATECGISQGQTRREAPQKWSLPSGDFLCADGYGGMQWRTRSGELLSAWPGPKVSHVAVNSTGSLVFVIQEKSLWWVRLSERDMSAFSQHTTGSGDVTVPPVDAPALVENTFKGDVANEKRPATKR